VNAPVKKSRVGEKKDAQQQPELQYQPWLTLRKSNVVVAVVVGRYASMAKAVYPISRSGGRHKLA
jgi:hypothetical protein